MTEAYLIPLIILFPLLLLFLKQSISPSSKLPPLPPGPRPWPILGNILQIGKKPHVSFTEFSESHGPLISLRLGTQILVVGSSKAAAQEILRTHDKILSGRHVPHVTPAKRPELNYLSLGWAFECNDQWKFLRTLCKTKLFSGKPLELQASSREKKVKEMVNFLSSKEGKEVELGEVFFDTIFNMLSNIFMSVDLIRYGEGNEGIKGLIRRLLEVSSAPNLADYYSIFGRFDLQGISKKAMEVTCRIWAMWKPTILERRERKRSSNVSSQQDFLDILLDNAFTNEQINYLFTELFIAGTETSVTTIEWVMAELIRNPTIMKKAREELEQEIKKDFPTESHLAELPYLQACIKESLRLHPPGPILVPHRALESCKVMNYIIPKNAQVLVNVYAIGRDPKIWENPLVFEPERFLNSDIDYKGNDLEFLPFGAGRKICPGIPMASRHIPLILATLIHFFDWSLPFGKNPTELDMNDKFHIALQKEQPLVLIPAARNQKR